MFQRIGGPTPDHTSYGPFSAFSDPDDNGWVFQEVTTRLSGGPTLPRHRLALRATWPTRCGARLPRTANMRKRIGVADPDWPDCHAEYMMADRADTELPT